MIYHYHPYNKAEPTSSGDEGPLAAHHHSAMDFIVIASIFSSDVIAGLVFVFAGFLLIPLIRKYYHILFLFHNRLRVRYSDSRATVKGINMELKYVPLHDLLIQAGYTYQKSFYNKKEVLWEPDSKNEDSLIATTNMLRTPDSYGYVNVSYDLFHYWSLSMSATYTGSMIASHMVDPESEYTVLENTPVFFDLNTKVSYHMHLKDDLSLELFVGIKNVFNSYQTDFDAGINRDAGYIYGPTMPRTFIFGVKAGMFK
ncbi:MAG: TonB-dependent receptor [Bacteroidales bacterium]|nr:TonB-dependent receptor [Bacteroidales bacterium]